MVEGIIVVFMIEGIIVFIVYCVLFMCQHPVIFYSGHVFSIVHLFILQGGVTELIICELPSAHRWSDPNTRYGSYC